jgi:hypothetical protein
MRTLIPLRHDEAVRGVGDAVGDPGVFTIRPIRIRYLTARFP